MRRELSKSVLKYRSLFPAMSEFIARSCPQVVQRQPFISAPTEVFRRRTLLSASGAPGMGTAVRVFHGRFMVTGRRVGMLIHRRYGPMFFICLRRFSVCIIEFDDAVKNIN